MARILIADDDALYLDVFCEGMQAVGHDAVGVANGTAMMERLRAERFDVVFVDVVMDGGGAITLTHKINELDPTLPVIVITGRPELVESPVLVEGLRSAVTKLHKSATLSQLDAVVRRYARINDGEGGAET